MRAAPVSVCVVMYACCTCECLCVWQYVRAAPVSVCRVDVCVLHQKTSNVFCEYFFCIVYFSHRISRVSLEQNSSIPRYCKNILYEKITIANCLKKSFFVVREDPPAPQIPIIEEPAASLPETPQVPAVPEDPSIVAISNPIDPNPPAPEIPTEGAMAHWFPPQHPQQGAAHTHYHTYTCTLAQHAYITTYTHRRSTHTSTHTLTGTAHTHYHTHTVTGAARIHHHTHIHQKIIDMNSFASMTILILFKFQNSKLWIIRQKSEQNSHTCTTHSGAASTHCHTHTQVQHAHIATHTQV